MKYRFQENQAVAWEIVGKAINSILTKAPLSINEKRDYLNQQGKNLSRNFNRQILGGDQSSR